MIKLLYLIYVFGQTGLSNIVDQDQTPLSKYGIQNLSNLSKNSHENEVLSQWVGAGGSHINRKCIFLCCGSFMSHGLGFTANTKIRTICGKDEVTDQIVSR